MSGNPVMTFTIKKRMNTELFSRICVILNPQGQLGSVLSQPPLFCQVKWQGLVFWHSPEQWLEQVLADDSID